jgi:hypothetical protein
MDEEERADLVARLFVLMTCKLEDAAGDAADGQWSALRNLVQFWREPCGA